MPVLPRLRAALHRPAAAGDPARARRRLRARPAAARLRPRGAATRSTPSGSRWCSTSAPASPSCPTARSATATAETRALEPAPGRHRAGADPARPRASERVAVDLPRFDVGESEGGTVGAPRRAGHADRRPPRDDGPRPACSPSTASGATGLPGRLAARTTTTRSRAPPPGRRRSPRSTATLVARVAREFARNAEVTEGRSMICMGAGTNHWFHSDQTYRTFLALVMMCGCEGVNGGGWAHYVGQEKVRPAGRLADARLRPGLDAPAAPPVGDAVLLPGHRPVALRAHPARATSPRRSAAGCSRAATSPTSTRSARGWAGCRPTRASTAARSTWSTRPSAAGVEPAEHVVASCARAGCASPARTPTRPATTRR